MPIFSLREVAAVRAARGAIAEDVADALESEASASANQAVLATIRTAEAAPRVSMALRTTLGDLPANAHLTAFSILGDTVDVEGRASDPDRSVAAMAAGGCGEVLNLIFASEGDALEGATEGEVRLAFAARLLFGQGCSAVDSTAGDDGSRFTETLEEQVR